MVKDIRKGFNVRIIDPKPEPRLALAYCRQCKEYFKEWVTTTGAINSAYQYDYCSKCQKATNETLDRVIKTQESEG